MTSPQVDGAYPRRAAAANSATGTGPKPKVGSNDRARAEQLAANFSAQMELSMMQSLTQLSAGGSGDESGEGGEDGGGDTGVGIDAGMQQTLLMTSIMSGLAKGGGSANSAQVQAQLSALGLGSLGGASAGAGSEAKLAQQLLAALGAGDPAAGSGAVDGASAASGTSAAGYTGSVDSGAAANAKVVAQVARERGVDPTLAVAMMLVESGGRSTAVGDGGTSFGLFQLHEGGMLTAAGLTRDQAFDPRTNAAVALKSLRHEWEKGHERRSPGEIAAASQRPADPVGYAAKVDAAMDRARALLAGT